jgi:AcrR family transcriptional regulator
MAHIPTETRRQQFINAAVTVIARDGVDGATTRRIAGEADAPLATLHYCFQTKENLLWAVFEELAEIVRADLEATVPEVQGPAEMAGQLLNETLRGALAHPAGNRAQLEIWLWAERNDEALAARLYDVYLDAWKKFLRETTPPLPEEHVETVARVVLGLVDGLTMQLISHGDARMVQRELATATAMLSAYLSMDRLARLPQ